MADSVIVEVEKAKFEDEVVPALRNMYFEEERAGENGDDKVAFMVLNQAAVTKRLAQNDRLLEEAKKAKALRDEALAKFDGVDVDDYKRLQEADHKRQKNVATEKGDWEKSLKLEKDESAKKIKVKDDIIESLRGDLATSMKEGAAIRAIEAEGGEVSVLLPHVLPMLDIEEPEGGVGTRNLRVVDKEGGARIDTTTGEAMTPQAAVRELKEVKSFRTLFGDPGKVGGGTPPKAGGQGGGKKTGAAGVGGGLTEFVLPRADGRDNRKYRQGQEDAKKAGLKFRVQTQKEADDEAAATG